MAIKSSKTDINELAVKVIESVNKALRQLTEKAAANNENLIIGDKDGNAQSIPAKEILKTLSK